VDDDEYYRVELTFNTLISVLLMLMLFLLGLLPKAKL